MSVFAFRKHETAAESLGRIVAELLQSIRELIPQAETRGEALHEISKATKRLRAIARLIPGSDGETLRDSVQRFRRPIGPRRDAQVMRKIWKEMSERLSGIAEATPEDRSEALARHVLKHIMVPLAATEWLRDLDRIHRDWEQVELPPKKTPWFLDAVRKQYRRGHRVVQSGLHAASDHRLHKFRKAVKQTQYHLELMHKACPLRLSHEHDLWQQLGELLGRHHDLSVFRETLAHSDIDRHIRLATESIVAAVEEERDELTRTIGREAPQVYLLRPRAFAEFLHRAWTYLHHQDGPQESSASGRLACGSEPTG